MIVRVLIAAAALTIASAAGAQTPPSPPPPDPFEQAIAASRVAAFARRTADPQAMIVAARMLGEIPVKDRPGSEDATAAFSPAALFAEARTLARGDQATLLQIQVAQSTASRGVLDSVFGKGLLRLVKDVAARANYRFDVVAQGGLPLRIGAIGDLGTAMVLRLVDAAGRVACADDNGDYAPVCSIVPRSAGTYHVELLNRSTRPSRAVILSN